MLTSTQPPSICAQSPSHWPHSSHASLPLELMAPSRRYRNLVSGGAGHTQPPASRGASAASILGPAVPVRSVSGSSWAPPAVLGQGMGLPATPPRPLRFETRGTVVVRAHCNTHTHTNIALDPITCEPSSPRCLMGTQTSLVTRSNGQCLGQWDVLLKLMYTPI